MPVNDDFAVTREDVPFTRMAAEGLLANDSSWSRIVDFTDGEDRIALKKSLFISLAHVDYIAATGALTFDPGAPGGPVFHFASVARNLALTDADFVLV